MRLTSKGQVTIPLALRERYGFPARGEVVFEAAEGGVLIKPVAPGHLRRLKAALRRARGSADAGLTTAAVMKLTRDDAA
jgi:bifunctional DNA-binding transcriptional regulator/antitoxin component of YhaV-PrlF toxin-antitoxin module